MSKYLSMLRGINVSGQKSIKMDELIKLFELLNYKNVTTYIQSGNVMFDSSEEKPENIAEKIQKKIKKEFSFEVPVIIRTKQDLSYIINTNPFLKRKDIDHSKLHLTFLSKMQEGPIPRKIMETISGEDEFSISGKEIYLFCPNGYGKTKFNNSFFEKKLNTIATTRNWNTVKNLFKMMG
jgi:uncharacterized protein (DUF1697 family)